MTQKLIYLNSLVYFVANIALILGVAHLVFTVSVPHGIALTLAYAAMEWSRWYLAKRLGNVTFTLKEGN